FPSICWFSSIGFPQASQRTVPSGLTCPHSHFIFFIQNPSQLKLLLLYGWISCKCPSNLSRVKAPSTLSTILPSGPIKKVLGIGPILYKSMTCPLESCGIGKVRLYLLINLCITNGAASKLTAMISTSLSLYFG